MLKHLRIQNYAIIDEIEIIFGDGLNAITGETGAGKSILMGALGLILGERADSSALQDREKKCVVEGEFNAAANKAVMLFLKENELDCNDEVMIRREIAVNGKSRAFINDTPVNLDQIRELSSLLVDLHSQFDTLELSKNDFQREVIDALCDHQSLLENYQHCHGEWVTASGKLKVLELRQSQSNKELDYKKFIFEELDEASFREHELEELDAELKLLSNSEEIKSVLSQVYAQMNEGDQPLVQQLKTLANKIQHYSSLHEQLPSIVQRLLSAQVELADVADELDAINEKIGYDAERISLVNDRIALGHKLMKKHGVHSTHELLTLKDDLGRQLNDVLNIADEIAQLSKETEQLLGKTKGLAQKISANRNKQSGPFAKRINELLARVGMPNARISVEISSVELNAFGADKVIFLFDANKSGKLEPFSKVASGGELSRLMLCVKSLVAGSLQLPTLIFDEIDTGISGEAAKQVGVIMKELSDSHQVIVITHQPQIAGKALSHYFVFKEAVGEKVKTRIRLLDRDERITAIAKMLSGSKPTAAALENAREMMN